MLFRLFLFFSLFLCSYRVHSIPLSFSRVLLPIRYPHSLAFYPSLFLFLSNPVALRVPCLLAFNGEESHGYCRVLLYRTGETGKKVLAVVGVVGVFEPDSRTVRTS